MLWRQRAVNCATVRFDWWRRCRSCHSRQWPLPSSPPFGFLPIIHSLCLLWRQGSRWRAPVRFDWTTTWGPRFHGLTPVEAAGLHATRCSKTRPLTTLRTCALAGASARLSRAASPAASRELEVNCHWETATLATRPPEDANLGEWVGVRQARRSHNWLMVLARKCPRGSYVSTRTGLLCPYTLAGLPAIWTALAQSARLVAVRCAAAATSSF